jgi:tRNA (Thr-GGU) A37 N-methylase
MSEGSSEAFTVDGLRVRVRDLEAIDGTPILDVKPQLPGIPSA